MDLSRSEITAIGWPGKAFLAIERIGQSTGLQEVVLERFHFNYNRQDSPLKKLPKVKYRTGNKRLNSCFKGLKKGNLYWPVIESKWSDTT